MITQNLKQASGTHMIYRFDFLRSRAVMLIGLLKTHTITPLSDHAQVRNTSTFTHSCTVNKCTCVRVHAQPCIFKHTITRNFLFLSEHNHKHYFAR